MLAQTYMGIIIKVKKCADIGSVFEKYFWMGCMPTKFGGPWCLYAKVGRLERAREAGVAGAQKGVGQYMDIRLEGYLEGQWGATEGV